MSNANIVKIIQDASVDAQSLSEFMYKPADFMVERRLAPAVHTFDYYLNALDGARDNVLAELQSIKDDMRVEADNAIAQMFENGGLPATPFATKALMEASALVDGDYAAVTNDVVKSNNGLYLKTAGVWIESDFGKPEVDKAYLDIVSADLFAKTLDTKFPDANLAVRRYLTTGAITNYAEGTYQVASEQGLKINVPASGSSGTKHFFSTGVAGYNSVDMEFTLITEDTYFSIGLGYIDSDGEYVMYSYSSSGTIRYTTGSGSSVDIEIGKPTYGVGDRIRLTINGKDLTYYKNDEVVYERELTEGIDGREILIGQVGFSEYSVSMKAVNDPIRDYVDEKIDSDVTSINESYLESQSANLFANLLNTKFPDANLPVRRYLTTGQVTDYEAGSSQLSTPDGLKITVPASGSSSIVHYFSTGLVGFNEVTATFEISFINSSQGDAFGLGFIDDDGQYVMYSYSNSGVLRKIVNQRFVADIVTKLPTSGVGDTLKIEIKSDKVLCYKNNELVYTHDLDQADSINGRQIIFGQMGFSHYVVNMSAKSDPIRNYVDSKLAQAVSGSTGTTNPKAYYQFNKTGGVHSVGLLKTYTQIKDSSYVGFDVAHEVDKRDAQYLDYWRIVKADFYTLTNGAMVATGKTALTGGESEFVWKQNANKVDFTGGYHGDEQAQDMLLLVDGLPVSLSESIELTPCSSIKYIVNSTMHETANRNSDPFIEGHPVVAYHTKETEFFNGGYKTYNKIKWNYEGTMSTLYHGISCISKDVASTVVGGIDFTAVEMTGSGTNAFDDVGGRAYNGYNTANKLASTATSRILNNESSDKSSTYWVHDRSVDSKYYRKSPPKNVVVGEVMESEFSCFFHIS